jgi:hypothetical protein
MTGQQLLDSLKDVPWWVAARTYGSFHATLIGLMVQWWLTLDGGNHTVVESGPSVGGGDRRACDAVFCLGDDAAGLLEVEGGKIPETLDKIECFFSSPEPDLKTLEFVVFVVYAYIPRARCFRRLYGRQGVSRGTAGVYSRKEPLLQRYG